jgi:hypothetical protein
MPATRRSQRRVRVIVIVLTVLIAGSAISSAAGSPGYTIAGLTVQPQIGAFGHVPGTGCDFSTLTGGCKAETFTFTNVGSGPILSSAMGINDPSDLAWGILAQGTTCQELPVVDGYWVLAPGASCTISVLFDPNEPGNYKNELRVWYGSTVIAIVPLHGVSS